VVFKTAVGGGGGGGCNRPVSMSHSFKSWLSIVVPHPLVKCQACGEGAIQ
jgi:hypothetical protein